MSCPAGYKTGWLGKKKENFFFSVFRAIPVRALAPMSRFQLPSVKYVYVVDCKSMIGGYRTLLLMNSAVYLSNPVSHRLDQSNPLSRMTVRSAMLGKRFVLGSDSPVNGLVLFPSVNHFSISVRSYV
jgi:hypothetical protein